MNQYQDIFHRIQKILLEKTINIFPDFRGRILNSTVNEIVKFVRLERARAKKELVSQVEEELEYFSTEKDGKKIIDLDDVNFILEKLQRETFLFNNEVSRERI